jgi:hypothetical protein
MTQAFFGYVGCNPIIIIQNVKNPLNPTFGTGEKGDVARIDSPARRALIAYDVIHHFASTSSGIKRNRSTSNRPRSVRYKYGMTGKDKNSR